MKNIGLKIKGLPEVKHLFDAKTYKRMINDALEETAKKAKVELQEEMTRVFDRPTRWTLTRPYFIRHFNNLSIEWKLRDLKADEYLWPHIEGGSREQKGSEKYLQKIAGVGHKVYWVPGAGVKLNKYGNVSGGQITQILSVLKALPEVGYLGNITERSKRRAEHRVKKPKPPREFFIAKGHSRLHPGVWEKVKHGRIRPILLFIKDPQYSERLDFYGTIANSFKKHLQGRLNIQVEELNR